jgi:hypothetical protein
MKHRDNFHCCNDSAGGSNEDCHTLSCKDELFQKRSERVLEALSLKPLSFNEVVKQSGLNPLYVKQCLNYLVSGKKVNRTPEDAQGARGRPRVFYSLSSNTIQQKPKSSAHLDIDRLIRDEKNPKKPNLPSTVTLEIDFQKLKTACKHEKGGNCKLSLKQGTFQKCVISKCPLSVTHKIRLVN